MKQHSHVFSILGVTAFAASVACGNQIDLSNIPSLSSTADAIQISEVSFKQNLTGRDVAVNYTLSGQPAYIMADVLTNGVSLGQGSLKSFYGDVSPNGEKIIQPGRHSFFWQARKDWPDHLVDNLQVEVRAFYTNELAAAFKYAVVDISAGSGATSYPVKFYVDVPEGAQDADGKWVDAYKLTKIVFRSVGHGPFRADKTTKNATAYDVSVTRDFFIGVFELTQKQWNLVNGDLPSAFTQQRDKRPMENISYNHLRGTVEGAKWPASHAVDSTSYLGRLCNRTGYVFDLPTRAQWEFACRAGTTGDLYSGKAFSESNVVELGLPWRGAWNAAGVNGATAEPGRGTNFVGSYIPNAWGLYDMLGNVWEWVLDWSGTSATDYHGLIDPAGPATGTSRILCGGGFGNDFNACHAASITSQAPGTQNWAFGCRLVLLP